MLTFCRLVDVSIFWKILKISGYLREFFSTALVDTMTCFARFVIQTLRSVGIVRDGLAFMKQVFIFPKRNKKKPRYVLEHSYAPSTRHEKVR